jgi:hypothetical protein
MNRIFGAGGGGGGGTAGGGGDVGSSKYNLPPFPHPLPERSLSLHCSPEGLFIVPARPIIHKQPSSSFGSFRRHHSPRTSITSITEDVASDLNLTTNTASEWLGAKVSWGKAGKVQAASSAELKRVSKEDNILCYGIVGIQHLFNGEGYK